MSLFLLAGCMPTQHFGNGKQYVRGYEPEKYCYETLAQADCYATPQPLPPNRQNGAEASVPPPSFVVAPPINPAATIPVESLPLTP
ncbi:MAG: hypothetical protein EBQ89_06765 [Alphaproteobacteria bacterium]|nr:hypothetical protein [Alphaproteobacteria bacterium]